MLNPTSASGNVTQATDDIANTGAGQGSTGSAGGVTLAREARPRAASAAPAPLQAAAPQEIVGTLASRARASSVAAEVQDPAPATTPSDTRGQASDIPPLDGAGQRAMIETLVIAAEALRQRQDAAIEAVLATPMKELNDAIAALNQTNAESAARLDDVGKLLRGIQERQRARESGRPDQ